MSCYEGQDCICSAFYSSAVYKQNNTVDDAFKMRKTYLDCYGPQIPHSQRHIVPLLQNVAQIAVQHLEGQERPTQILKALQEFHQIVFVWIQDTDGGQHGKLDRTEQETIRMIIINRYYQPKAQTNT